MLRTAVYKNAFKGTSDLGSRPHWRSSPQKTNIQPYLPRPRFPLPFFFDVA